MHRTFSLRPSSSSRATNTSTSSAGASTNNPSPPRRRHALLPSLRPHHQQDISKRLARLIKTFNALISSHQQAGKERQSIATQLSEWGESTADPAVSDISDKVGVILAEMGEHEDNYAHALDEARGMLKVVRNTERGVGPVRAGRARIEGELAKVAMGGKAEEGRRVVLEQELVRAEAEGLVAEAQLGNVTRQKLKEAYTAEFLATIERAEKQAILARHGLRLLQALDDTPVVPGDVRTSYEGAAQTRQILNDAEDDLRDWRFPEGLLGSEDDSGGKETARDATPTPGRQGEKSPDRGSIATGRGKMEEISS